MPAPRRQGELVTCALAAGCGGSSGPLTVKDDRNGDTVKVDQGDPLVLNLRENQATGYTWRFTDRPDARVLRLTGSTFVAPDTNPPRAGASGRHVYRFRAAGLGRTSIGLGLYPPQRDAKQFAHYGLTVDVR